MEMTILPNKSITRVYSVRFLSPLPMALLAFFLLIGLAISIWRLPHYLSPVKLLDGDFLIVEGWIPDYALEKAANLFFDGNYKRLLVTGCDLEVGSLLVPYKNNAAIGAASLKKIGIPDSCIIEIPSGGVLRNRTLSGALEVRKWLQRNNQSSGIVDVCTSGPHGRRTWHLYKKALKPASFNVGIISIPVRDYPLNRWFLYSEGFRQVTSEVIALVYVFLFFF